MCQPPEVLDALSARLDGLVDHLADALEVALVDLGHDAYRPLVRDISFVGGWLAGQQASPSLAVKLPYALGAALAEATSSAPRIPNDLDPHDRVDPVWRALEASLAALLTETYCRSLRAEAKQREQDRIEGSTPLIRLQDGTPALLLVGSPTRATLSALSGRVLLEVARRGDPRLIIDFTHAGPLADPAWAMIAELLSHRKLEHQDIILCSLPAEGARALARHAPGITHHAVETWDALMATLRPPQSP